MEVDEYTLLWLLRIISVCGEYCHKKGAFGLNSDPFIANNGIKKWFHKGADMPLKLCTFILVSYGIVFYK